MDNNLIVRLFCLFTCDTSDIHTQKENFAPANKGSNVDLSSLGLEEQKSLLSNSEPEIKETGVNIESTSLSRTNTNVESNVDIEPTSISLTDTNDESKAILSVSNTKANGESNSKSPLSSTDISEELLTPVISKLYFNVPEYISSTVQMGAKTHKEDAYSSTNTKEDDNTLNKKSKSILMKDPMESKSHFKK